MSRLIKCIILITSLATVSFAQTMQPAENSGMFTGAMGMTVIDDQTFFTINLRPDISIGKFGVGLNVNLLYNTKNGAIRSEDWNESYDWARLIRYVRYGHKGDNFYTRVGALDAHRLGHGFIMNYYTNEASYDKRKIGLALDIDFGTFGFESVTNNMGRLEIIGGRGYARPLRPYIDIPIIKNLTFGATFVTDVDPDGLRATDDGITEFGLDIELPLVNVPMFNTLAYFDVAQIKDYGSGTAFGIAANLSVIANVAEISAKLERRLLGEEFLPSYFDAFYEIQRYQPMENGTLYRKDENLALIQTDTKGIFGELGGHVLNTLHIIGNFQRLDDTNRSGILHLAADIPDAIPKIAAQATYDKIGIETLNDAFTLDDRSIARIGVGYKINPYLMFFMDYIYSFQFNEEKNAYEAQKRFSPRVAFVYNFGL